MQTRKVKIKYYKIKHYDFVFIILTIFLIGFIFGIQLAPETGTGYQIKYRVPNLTSISDERAVEMLVPAVDENGNGVAARLITRVRPAFSPGYGMMLVSINDVLAQYDTQLSARIAAKAAEKYTMLDLTDFDIIYTIEVNASVIEGPSAGAAMAISVVAALENKTPSTNVMITGTIDEDGNIGPAGSIIGKARAAKENNITLFLVSGEIPPQNEFQKQTECRTINSLEYCEINYVPVEIDISESLGITIKKVDKLEDALGYFIP